MPVGKEVRYSRSILNCFRMTIISYIEYVFIYTIYFNLNSDNKTKLPSPLGASYDHTFSLFPTYLPGIKKNISKLR